ncbi:MAG: nucleotidyltransferase [Deltaproteobacteria bacterium]|nr:MAG: nucleotidyltransferase [Deltaproteobacteria bacterium]
MTSPLEDYRTELAAIAAKAGVRSVRVFGSRARGDNDPDSDLDLVVQLEPGRGLLDLAGFKLELEALLGCSVDVVTEAGLSPYLRDQILRESVPIDLEAA